MASPKALAERAQTKAKMMKPEANAEMMPAMIHLGLNLSQMWLMLPLSSVIAAVFFMDQRLRASDPVLSKNWMDQRFIDFIY